jgi:hypothetical protein
MVRAGIVVILLGLTGCTVHPVRYQYHDYVGPPAPPVVIHVHPHRQRIHRHFRH